MSLMSEIRRAARLELEENRRRAERDHQKSIEIAYSRCPELETVDNEVRIASLNLVQKMAQGRGAEEAQTALDQLRQKREQLLKDAGMVKTATDFKPFCKECNDSGRVNGKQCKCYERALTRAMLSVSRIGTLCKEQTFKNSDLSLFSDIPDPKFGLSPRQNYAELTESCKEFAKNIKRVDGENLYLYGSAGSGKTYLCSAIAEHVMKNGHSVLYYSAFELFRVAPADMGELLSLLEEVDLLILDDLGTEYVSEYSSALFFYIVNTRINAKKKTVISSNLNLTDLANAYSARVASRISGAYTLLPFFGKDLRRDKLTERSV